MRRVARLLALALGLAAGRAAASSTDGTDPLAAIPARIDALDFDGAQSAIDAALRTGTLAPRDVARAYVLRGVIDASRKDPARAEHDFARGLRIDPAAALPVGVAPHVAAPFERARASATPPLDAKIAVAPTDARRDLVAHVVVSGDPDRLARRAQVRAGGQAVEAAIAGDATDVVVAAAIHRCAPIRVRLLDAFGNDLFDSGDVVPRCDAAPTAPPARPSSSITEGAVTSRPMPAYAWVGVATTGAFAATTAVLGVFALQKRSTFDAANRDPGRVADRGPLRDDALAAERNATIAAVATVVAGGVTLALVLTRPSVATPVTLAASPRAGGGAIELRARF